MKSIKILGSILLFSICQLSFAQSDKEKALEKGMQALKYMDNGQIDKSITLLEEAQKLDPERFDYPYEMAYAYHLKKEYKETIKILEKSADYKGITERYYQLLGNTYDELGKSEKAIEVYDKGLKQFPNSGMIWLEKGNVYWGKEDYNKALTFYEKGIELDPKFPSNYYRAARIYCNSTEEVWGLLYGEIFMNIERGSARTSEISKLLYDTYKSQIKFKEDGSFSVSFSKNATMVIDDAKDPSKMKLPFGIGVYEPMLMMSMLTVKTIDLNSLNTIRTTFVDNYFKNDNEKKYPNIVYSYHKKLKEADHLEAYNYWILMRGDQSAFDEWHTANTDKWDAFIKWFTDNKLKVDESNKFFQYQY